MPCARFSFTIEFEHWEHPAATRLSHQAVQRGGEANGAGFRLPDRTVEARPSMTNGNFGVEVEDAADIVRGTGDLPLTSNCASLPCDFSVMSMALVAAR